MNNCHRVILIFFIAVSYIKTKKYKEKIETRKLFFFLLVVGHFATNEMFFLQSEFGKQIYPNRKGGNMNQDIEMYTCVCMYV